MIYKYMDISTGNLRREDAMLLDAHISHGRSCEVRVIGHDYGYFVNVPHDDQDDIYKALVKQGFSDDFVHCLIKAYARDCYWINFDQDGFADEELPFFEW